MTRLIGGSICAVALLTATSAAAEGIVLGTVKRVDERAGIVVLDDGRAIQATPPTILLVDKAPDHLGAVAPGARIVVITDDQTGGQAASPRLAPDPAVLPRGDRPDDVSGDRGRGIQAP